MSNNKKTGAAALGVQQKAPVAAAPARAPVTPVTPVRPVTPVTPAPAAAVRNPNAGHFNSSGLGAATAQPRPTTGAALLSGAPGAVRIPTGADLLLGNRSPSAATAPTPAAAGGGGGNGGGGKADRKAEKALKKELKGDKNAPAATPDALPQRTLSNALLSDAGSSNYGPTRRARSSFRIGRDTSASSAFGRSGINIPS